MDWTRKLVGIAVVAAALSGCASGKQLTLSGPLLAPARAVPESKVVPRVAVVDFEFAGGEGAAIGRDFDNVRAIAWKGTPGAAVADIVAASLSERGVPVVRVAMAGHVPGGVLVTVKGRIDDFRVSAKRLHSVKVESEAHVALTLFAEGENVAQDWSTGRIESDVWSTEPFFVTPDGVREALGTAASGAGDEAASRIMALREAFTPR